MRVDLRFPSDPRLLRTIRSVVAEMAELCGFAEGEAQFIILAVDEACANVIRHAYQGRTDGEIAFPCSASEERIEFLLVDQGQAPRPEELQRRPLEEIRPGGLGTHLIRSVMDQVRYRCSERGNELFLAKSLRPRRRVETGATTE